MKLISQVIISENTEETVLQLEALKTTESFVKILKEDNFLVEDAQLAIEKAYMTSEEISVIVLGGKFFSPVVQNKLLKIIEEPPRNKIFILITPSKSTILATIRSRLPITILSETKAENILDLDMEQLSLATVYMFIQHHKRTDGKTMKKIVEEIAKQTLFSQAYHLDTKTLNLFSNAYLALDVASPPPFVLTTLLLKLLAKKKR